MVTGGHYITNGYSITDSRSIMGIQERRIREKDLRRQTIFEAARRQFLAHGLDNVKMSEIAREAELSKGTLYLYFNDKTDLMYSLLLESLHDLRERVTTVADGEGTAMEKVHELLERYIEFFHERQDFFPLFQYLDYAFSTGAPESSAEACFGVIYELTGRIEQLLNEGMADGSFRADLEPGEQAVVYAHMIHSFMEQVVSREGFLRAHSGFEPEVLIRRMFKIIIDSLQ